MKFITSHLIPESRHLPDSAKGREALRNCIAEVNRSPTARTVWLLLALAGASFCGTLLVWRTHTLAGECARLAILVVASVPGLWGLRLYVASLRRILRETLHQWGICPSCGYDLRGNTSGTCPECGLAIPALAGMNTCEDDRSSECRVAPARRPGRDERLLAWILAGALLAVVWVLCFRLSERMVWSSGAWYASIWGSLLFLSILGLALAALLFFSAFAIHLAVRESPKADWVNRLLIRVAVCVAGIASVAFILVLMLGLGL
jgi:predicted nucleic acid-binding Zn ribbon protein